MKMSLWRKLEFWTLLPIVLGLAYLIEWTTGREVKF